MWTRLLVATGFAAFAFSAPAEALVTIDWVQIGAPGNPVDTDPNNDNCQARTGFRCGRVADRYAIGKYEVTNAQYAEFLNAVADDDPNGLYNADMAGTFSSEPDITRSGSAGSFTYATVAGREDKPVGSVSWFDSVRFVNWLANGQPTGAQGPGTTETGTYTLTSRYSISGGRASGASIFLPTEDEWYKAAYFDPALSVYYDYPAGSDAQTVCAFPTATANRANCGDVVGDTTDVGAYTGSASPFGTFDQGGNVWEWNETDTVFGDGSVRGVRGGALGNSDPGFLGAAGHSDFLSVYERRDLGFRVASAPEPATSLLLMAGILGLAGWRRRVGA